MMQINGLGGWSLRAGAWGKGAASVLVAAFNLSCLYPTAPDSGEQPQLQVLRVNATSRPEFSGVVKIDAEPTDRSFRLSAHRRVPVEVVVSSGDVEVARLFRTFCPARDRSEGYFCHSFTFVLRAGHHVDDLEERVRGLGGRYRSKAFSGNFADVYVFDHTRLVRTARKVESWPEVAYANLDYPFYSDLSPSHSLLSIVLPVESGAARSGDGIVQLQSGDTVSVRYAQPNGTTLTAMAVAR